jgi:hypothetical protein
MPRGLQIRDLIIKGVMIMRMKMAVVVCRKSILRFTVTTNWKPQSYE